MVTRTVEYIELDVHCYGCGLSMTPDTTAWELFRVGIHSHNNEDCFEKILNRLGVSKSEAWPQDTEE